VSQKRRPGRPPREPDDGGSSTSSSSSSAFVLKGDEVLSEATARDRVQVIRFDSRGGTWNYCGTYDPDAVRAVGVTEFVRARGGGGRYRVRLRRPDGTYGRMETLAIEGIARPWDDDTRTVDDVAGSSSSSSSSSSAGSIEPPRWLERILFPIGTTFATAFAGYLAKKLLEEKPRERDPLLAELAKNLKAAGMDPLELQRTIADAEERGERRGREFGELTAKLESGGAGAGDGIGGAIDRGLPQLVGLLNRKMELDEKRLSPPAIASDAAETVSSSSSSSSSSSGSDGTPAEPSPGTAPADPLVALLLGVPMGARKFLLNAAEEDEPPELYAALILSKLDDVTYARMPALVNRSDFVDVFIATYPAFVDFREWTDELAAALRATLEAREKAAAEDAAPMDPQKVAP
jgi:hypothetical protein